MEKGTWVVCINDSNWDPNAYIKMSSLPVKNELYQVREFIPDILKLTKTGGIKLEGIYGEERFFHSKDKKTYWLEYHFCVSRFQVVNDLWSFLTERSDVEEKTIVVRRSQQELLNSLVNTGSEDLKQ